jgi:rubredoxin
MRNETKAVPVRVLCPDCGPQEHRGFVAPVYVHRDPKWVKRDTDSFTDSIVRTDYVGREGVSRFADPNDDSCPKCGTKETIITRTDLAISVKVASTSYFEQEAFQLHRRRMMAGNRVYSRAVTG